MNVRRVSASSFLLEFESAEEVREEHRSNLSQGALFLPTSEIVPLHTKLEVTLLGPGGTSAAIKASVVAALPHGIALAIDGEAEGIVSTLLNGAAAEPEAPSAENSTNADEDTPERRQTSWDRIRGMSQTEKILMAVRADRGERALLIQNNDPRVLLSLLRNPKLTMDEVIRLSKSTFLNFQIADAIMSAGQWMGNLDVRIGLINNPKTPLPFALRILLTLPDAEVRTIARSGASMALKQAALRRLQKI